MSNREVLAQVARKCQRVAGNCGDREGFGRRVAVINSDRFSDRELQPVCHGDLVGAAGCVRREGLLLGNVRDRHSADANGFFQFGLNHGRSGVERERDWRRGGDSCPVDFERTNGQRVIASNGEFGGRIERFIPQRWSREVFVIVEVELVRRYYLHAAPENVVAAVASDCVVAETADQHVAFLVTRQRVAHLAAGDPFNAADRVGRGAADASRGAGRQVHRHWYRPRSTGTGVVADDARVIRDEIVVRIVRRFVIRSTRCVRREWGRDACDQAADRIPIVQDERVGSAAADQVLER